MIGNNYYSTGISACHVYAGDWQVSLEFFDLGHAQVGATSGALKYTYLVSSGELRSAIETLLRDAKQLGIQFIDNSNAAPALRPRLYVGSMDRQKPGDWREIFQPLANAISFELMEVS